MLLGDFDTKIRLLRGNRQTTIGEKLTKVLNVVFKSITKKFGSFLLKLIKAQNKTFYAYVIVYIQ